MRPVWHDPTDLTFEERFQQLERLIRIPTSLDDLPLTDLQRNLESSWHPEGSVLLEPGSVTELVTDRGEYFPVTPAMFSAPWRNIAGGGGANNDCHYWRDSNGIVHIHGTVDKNGGNWIANELIFTLPGGFRPIKNETFASAMSSNGFTVHNVGHIDVLASGAVNVGLQGGTANPVSFASLAGISFRGV